MIVDGKEFTYLGDAEAYTEFKNDLQHLYSHKERHCAPSMENYWIEALWDITKNNFTKKAQLHLLEYIQNKRSDQDDQ